MQPYDWLMILLVLLTTLWGAWKGLARQLASLASLVVSYFVSLRFSPVLAPKINLDPPLNRLAAMAIVFVLCSLAIWLLFRMVSGFIDRLKLQEFDRQMGGVIGAAQGVLLCVVVTFVAATVAVEPWKRQILTSKSGYYIGHMIDRAPAVMPREMHEVLSPYLRRLDQQLQHEHVDWE
ncbi:MAG: CvpA family protein [Planctomycetes bacterium]|nr:CvpA family protein [Planctomycetota bacterium]